MRFLCDSGFAYENSLCEKADEDRRSRRYPKPRRQPASRQKGVA